MNQTFAFTLTKEDYLQYLRLQCSTMKGWRGYRFWIGTSLPALFLCTLLITQEYRHIEWDIIALMISLLWLFYGAPAIWNVFLRHRINIATLKAMHIQGFSPVRITFSEEEILCDQDRIAYTEISAILPFRKLLVLTYQNGKAILLPHRLFQNKKERMAFLDALHQQWQKALERKPNV